MVSALMAEILGALGPMELRTSAEPDFEVAARLPCLAMRRREEARMEEVVETLKVECGSPPVPTMSH